MHLYILTRGIKRHVDKFINDCAAQSFPYKGEGLNPITGKREIKEGWLELGMRPIQLWEIAFPRESLQDVINMIQPSKGIPKSESHSSLRSFVGWIIRRLTKFLKLKPVPDFDPKAPRRLVHKQDIAVYGLGISEDKIVEKKTKFEAI